MAPAEDPEPAPAEADGEGEPEAGPAEEAAPSSVGPASGAGGASRVRPGVGGRTALPGEEAGPNAKGRLHAFRGEARTSLDDFLRRLEQSDLFFLAGAITFNVLVAVVPLILLVAGISGFALNALYERPGLDLLDVVLGFLPEVHGDVEFAQTVGKVVEGIVEERTGFSVIGALVLAWISTRLIGTIRVVLRIIFEIKDDRGIVSGKLFDFKVVIVAGLLLLVNVGVSFWMRAAQTFLEPDGAPGWVVALPGHLFAFGSAWVLFYLLYRYIPARRIPWRVALVGATFTAVFYELMKEAFAWYVTNFANFATAYGSLAVAAILFFWIYYGSVVFVLGGLVARTYEHRRHVRSTGDP